MKQEKPRKVSTKPDDFMSVAKRLGCDPDLNAFDKKLGKIAKSKPTKNSKVQ
jgi:hypothetical protein